jgi:Protein of unknown function (DUF551)
MRWPWQATQVETKTAGGVGEMDLIVTGRVCRNTGVICQDDLPACKCFQDIVAASKSRWRSIADDPPPKGHMFIYYWERRNKRAIGLAYWTVSGEWRDSEGDWTRAIEPTHWMPLPEPPT